MLQVKESDLPKIIRWVRTRGGVAVWHSVDLSRPSGELLTPAGASRPAWWVSADPVIITHIRDIEVIISREIKQLPIAIRRSSNGFSYKLTDASSRKVRKAAENGHYEFDYLTQKAIIYQDRIITAHEYLSELKPPVMLCINDRDPNGIKDPEVTENKFYSLVQRNVYIMDREPQLSVIGDNGIEISRDKTSFMELPL